jgi:hypothetical protein
MRLQTDNLRLGISLESMQRALQQVLPAIAKQVNAVSEGRIQGSHNAANAPPVSGVYLAGDYIKNKAPAVLGTAGSRYVVKGWICVTGGEPGTWVQDRGLTGT